MARNKSCRARAYDYIIVGSGPAGATLANVLSADGRTSVLLLEAGADDTRSEPIRDSLFAGVEFGLEQNFNCAYLWQCTPLNNGALHADSRCAPPEDISLHGNCVTVPGFPAGVGSEEGTTVGIYTTGRTLGGGSSINGQQYVNATPALYAAWQARTGSALWSVPAVGDALRSLQTYHGVTDVPQQHGFAGAIHVRQTPAQPTAMALKFVQATSAALGFARIADDDYNGFDEQHNVGPFARWQLSQQRNGDRESAATAFLGAQVLDPQGRGIARRLRLWTRTTVLRVLFQSGSRVPRAVGVHALRDGRLIRVRARREVILSCGAFSPSLLQQSGIGPAPLLRALHIPLVCDQPLVGLRWTNHTYVVAALSSNRADAGTPEDDPQALYTGGAFLPPLLQDDDPARRAYQLICASPSPGVFLLILIHLQPKSEGTLRIQSADPLTVPLVDNAYMTDERDVRAYVLALQRYVRPIADAMHAADPAYALLSPDAATLDDTDALHEWVRKSFDHTHHWQGSACMGRSPADGVVDPEGRVWGVRGLRVADSSIMPVIPDGNTQTPSYVIGWQIAQRIRQTRPR